MASLPRSLLLCPFCRDVVAEEAGLWPDRAAIEERCRSHLLGRHRLRVLVARLTRGRAGLSRRIYRALA